MELLLDRWRRASIGDGQCVLLSAEAGIGKSRVVRAVRDRVRAEPHAAHYFQCSPFHTNSAFMPLIGQLERAAEFVEGDTVEVKQAKLEALLQSNTHSTSESVDYCAALLSLPVESLTLSALPSQQLKDRIMQTQVRRLLDATQDRPSLIVFEDIHWADASTLEFMATLLDAMESAHALLLITHRPDFTAPWTSRSGVTALTLNRLSRRDTVSLAEYVSGKPLPPVILEQILARTDGIPLFVEELTKVVLESGLLREEADLFVADGPIPPFAIPATLHDSLMARLDRLASIKELIQQCAVIGREFSHALLSNLSLWSDTELEQGLNQLVTSELVLRRGAGRDAVYTFKHALVQDAAYESILRSLRQTLHARVARALQADQQLAQTNPGLLALHFDRAGDTEQAIAWCMSSGSKASSRSAHREALHHFERALELLESNPSSDENTGAQIEARTEIGVSLMILEGWASEQALRHFTRAETQCATDKDLRQRVRVLVGMITTLVWRGRSAEAVGRAEELKRIAQSSDERMHLIFAHQLAGQNFMYGGRYRAAAAEFESTLQLYDEGKDIHTASEYGFDPGLLSMWWLGYMQWEAGALDRAFDTADRALALARKVGHPFTLANSFAWMTDLSYFMWRTDRIATYAPEGIEVSQRHGFSHMLALCMIQYGWSMAQCGKVEEGLDQMIRGLELPSSIGTAAIVAPRLVAQTASVYGLAGRHEAGLELLSRSPDRQPGRRRVRYAETSRIEGDLRLGKRASDPSLAEHFYQEAIEIAIEDEAITKQLRAATSLAALWASQGKIVEAKSLLRPLYDQFTEGFDMPDMVNARALLSKLEA